MWLHNLKSQTSLEKIVIYLNSKLSWAIVDAASIVTEYVFDGDPADLANAATEKEIIVIVPAEDVLLTTANMPKMSQSRLMQALPFALEEQLIDDIEHLHFAIGERQENNELPVAIVKREKMQQWLELLKSWKIHPDVLLPISLILPYEDNKLHIMLDDMINIRLGKLHGLSVDKNNLNEILNIILSTMQKPVEQICIDNFTNEACNLNVPINVKEELHDPKRMISKLALHANKEISINLLQNEYLIKKSKLPQGQRVWRAIFYLSAAWVLLLILSPVISYFILAQKNNEIHAQINKIYMQQFPHASGVIAVKQRMQERLQSLSNGETNKFLLLLSHAANEITKLPNIKLKRLDFQNQQLALDLRANSSADVSKLIDKLTAQGFKVKQQNASLNDNQLNVILAIE